MTRRWQTSATVLAGCVAAVLVGLAVAIAPDLALLLAVAAVVFGLGFAVAIRLIVRPRELVPALLLCSLTIVRLPTLLPQQRLIWPVVLFPFVVAIALAGRRETRVETRMAVVGVGFVALVALSLIRGAATGYYGSWATSGVRIRGSVACCTSSTS